MSVRQQIRGAAPTALTLAALLAAPAPGEELTLAEAMRRARDGAREVAAARARAEAGAARVEEARAFRRPTVRLEEIWIYTDSPADVFGLQLQQEVFSFPRFVASDPNDPDFFDNATTRVEIALPVYTGGEISSRIRQAELGAEAAEVSVGWAGDGAALAAAAAWVQLAQVREQVALLERSLETARTHAGLARAYVDQGMMVRSELLRAEVEVSRLEDLLTEARGQAHVAEANLSFRLGADQGAPWRLAALPEPAPLGEDLAGWLSTTDGRGDLEAARRRVAAAELEEKVARAARKPRFGVAVRQDFYDELPLGAHGDNTSLIARGTLDLFAGGRHKAAAAAARAQARAAARDVERFAEGARLEVRSAYETAASARERHATAKAALGAAREAERITERRFEKGVVKVIDLLDASTARREAETRELVARADAHLATLELAVTAGRAPESVLVRGGGVGGEDEGSPDGARGEDPELRDPSETAGETRAAQASNQPRRSGS